MEGLKMIEETKYEPTELAVYLSKLAHEWLPDFQLAMETIFGASVKVRAAENVQRLKS
jgi:hypothetical protein